MNQGMRESINHGEAESGVKRTRADQESTDRGDAIVASLNPFNSAVGGVGNTEGK
jgi:hypothetical protein